MLAQLVDESSYGSPVRDGDGPSEWLREAVASGEAMWRLWLTRVSVPDMQRALAAADQHLAALPREIAGGH